MRTHSGIVFFTRPSPLTGQSGYVGGSGGQGVFVGETGSRSSAGGLAERLGETREGIITKKRAYRHWFVVDFDNGKSSSIDSASVYFRVKRRRGQGFQTGREVLSVRFFSPLPLCDRYRASGEPSVGRNRRLRSHRACLDLFEWFKSFGNFSRVEKTNEEKPKRRAENKFVVT